MGGLFVVCCFVCCFEIWVGGWLVIFGCVVLGFVCDGGCCFRFVFVLLFAFNFKLLFVVFVVCVVCCLCCLLFVLFVCLLCLFVCYVCCLIWLL